MSKHRFYTALSVGAGILSLCWGIVGLVSERAVAASDTGAIRFNRDIRPILSENCYHCHGSDPATRKEGLRLDREEGLFGERKSGRPVVKGDLKKSLLYQRIMTTDDDDVMPPPASHKALKPEQKELIRRWIEQGAPWEAHWAFVTPTRPALPAVKNEKWVRNPIDRFILAELEAKGLTPAPEADRRALIRRLSFDLTGLPPAPADVEAFVNDASADAYEKVVDRMMSTTDYAETRARYWLDAARYADTHGLHFDNYREIWPYRDWVINAFATNMRFDQFTIEQLAGDMLPNASLEQRIGSGFNRCILSTNEGGTIAEENLVMYTRDRTETTARVFLGLTVNCAVCHDHKFDPITQKDFYSLSAFFNNTTQPALDGNVKDSPPIAVVPQPRDRARYAALGGEIAAAKSQLASRRNAAKPEYEKWLAAADPVALAKAIPTTDMKLHAPLDEGQGMTAKVIVEGMTREVPLAGTTKWEAAVAAATSVKSPQGGFAEIAEAGDFEKDQAFTAAVWAKLPGQVTGSVVARMQEKDNYRGWDMWCEQGRIGMHFVSRWPENALKVLMTKPVDVNKWHHLCVTYDGSGKAAGVKVYVDGEAQPTKAENDTLKATTRTNVPFKIGQRNGTDVIKGLAVHDVRLYGRALAAGDVKQIAKSARLIALLSKPVDKRTEPEKNELFDFYLSTNDEPTRTIGEKISALEKEEADIKARGATTLVMAEKAEKPKAWVLFRGEYDKRRDEVAPATPGALPPMPADLPRNRLGFAKWLLTAENPLTARVTVNRFWQEVFGTGIVKTTEDFGIMGENPSHPELLDWLAVEFRESGWDVKHMFKLIVTSAAYRQSAAVTAVKIEKDPANRLLSRGPRFRMDAEVLRDNALAVSGLLVKKVGGPSVRPYQPPGVWEAVAMPESNTRNYKADPGENLYRRSMYTFWKRAAPPASMDVLNAPSREVCTVRRERTNTPLQALVTLNDPQFFEAARNLAQVTLESSGTFETRLDSVARKLLARPFTEKESQIARGAYEDTLAYYKVHVEEARKLVQVGESKVDTALEPDEYAAWTLLANNLMNLDEVLTK